MRKIQKMVNSSKRSLYMGIFMFVLCAVFLLSGCTEENPAESVSSNETSEESAAKKIENDDKEIKSYQGKRKGPENLHIQGYDVVFVIDNSKSVWNQQNIRNQAFKHIAELAMGSDIRIGMVYFADTIYEDYTISLTSMQNEEESKKVFEKLTMEEKDYSNIDTNIGTALERAVQLFSDQDSSRKRMIVLFSDGKNENEAQQKFYTEQANEKTEDQAEILKEMGIPVYCIYLQKERNDEEYLKKVVNYFSEDYSYVDERFSKLTENEIDQLTDKFIHVFYTMQNNMKYCKLSLDSSGRSPFYVPVLGVNKLQFFINGNFSKAEVNSPEIKGLVKWEEQPYASAYIEQPLAGDWSIEVESEEPHQISGSIAYYADLQAAAELCAVQDSSGTAKGKMYQIIIHFYDGEGNEILIDPKAVVTAEFFLSDEDDKEETALNMSVEDGKAKSEPFSLYSYGNADCQVNVTYDNFVDLDYLLDCGTVEKTAPVVEDLSNKVFYGEKTEDEKIHFILKEEEVYTDPEGEEVVIKEVIQLNPENPIKAEKKDGYFYLTAEKLGAVNFALQLEDTSGMRAEAIIEGELKNQADLRLLKKNLLIVGIVLILGFFIVLGKEILDKQLLRKLKDQFDDDIVEYELLKGDGEKQKEIFLEYQQDIALALNGDKEVKGIIELASALTLEQQESFRISGYLQEHFFDEIIAQAEKILERIEEEERNMMICRDAEPSIKDGKESDKLIKAMRRCCNTAKKVIERLDEECRQLQHYNEELEEHLGTVETLAQEIEDMLQTKITCDLNLRVLSEERHLQAKMSRYGDNGKLREGYYLLDDLTTMGDGALGTLGKTIGKTGIYVYGYQTDTQGSGLELKSGKEFTCNLLEDTKNAVSGKTVILLKGKKYILRCQAGQKETELLLNVI